MRTPAPLANDAASRVFLIDGGATAISAALNGLVIRDGNAGRGRGRHPCLAPTTRLC